MSATDIKDILVEFEGENLSKYGLFPLFTWYLNDVIRLPEYFEAHSHNLGRRKVWKNPLSTAIL